MVSCAQTTLPLILAEAHDMTCMMTIETMRWGMDKFDGGEQTTVECDVATYARIRNGGVGEVQD